MMRLKPFLLAGAVALGLAAPAAAEPVKVVASFSILADFVENVGGDRVAVSSLVGPDGDAHVFQPSPADARQVAEAKLLIVNGLGLEGWMERLEKAAGGSAKVITATQGIKARERTRDEPQEDEDEHAEAGHDHDHEEANAGHDHGPIDPHAWQSVANAKIYVANIRDALIAADPEGKAAYEANAAAYLARLDALDAEVRKAVAAIPAERRRIITSHDAFGYFGDAYGLKLIAPQGISTEAEASARDVARIIRQIRADKVPAVFIENITDKRLVERIAKETKARVGGTLYSDALSAKDGPAGTYIDMIRYNITSLSEALAS